MDILGDHPFAVYTVHSEPSKADALVGSRWREIPEDLKEWLRIQTGEANAILDALDDGPIILCGDFNGSPVGLRYKRFTENLTDAFASAGRGFGYTIPSNFPLKRIDWILVSLHWRVLDAFVPPQIGSDHRTVVADIVLK